MSQTVSQLDREQLRAANRVVPVSKEDEGVSWSKISNGVYGFTYTPGSADGGLFVRETLHSFEMHKLADGTLHILGYTDSATSERINAKTTQDIELYPQTRDDSPVLVQIPHARIASSKALDRDNANRLKATLKPVA
jgi:hypothetical protein